MAEEGVHITVTAGIVVTPIHFPSNVLCVNRSTDQ
eukprot:gene12981-33390_t